MERMKWLISTWTQRELLAPPGVPVPTMIYRWEPIILILPKFKGEKFHRECQVELKHGRMVLSDELNYFHSIMKADIVQIDAIVNLMKRFKVVFESY